MSHSAPSRSVDPAGAGGKRAEGVNSFLATLVDPVNVGGVKIPDNTTDATFVKRILGTTNLTGSSDYFFLITPFTKRKEVWLAGTTVTNPLTGNTTVGWTNAYSLDVDVTTNYSRSRLVSGFHEIYLGNTALTANTINGRVTATSVDTVQIPWDNFNPTLLTAYNTSKVIPNINLVDGIATLALPNSIPTLTNRGSKYVATGDSVNYINQMTAATVSYPGVTGSLAWTINSVTDPTFPTYFRGRVVISGSMLMNNGTPTTAGNASIVQFWYLNGSGVLTVENSIPVMIQAYNGAGTINYLNFEGECYLQYPCVQVTLSTLTASTQWSNYATLTPSNFILSCPSLLTSEETPCQLIHCFNVDTVSTLVVNRTYNYEVVPNFNLGQDVVGRRDSMECIEDYDMALMFLTHMGVPDVMPRVDYKQLMKVLPGYVSRRDLHAHYALGWSDVVDFGKKAFSWIKDNKSSIMPLMNTINPYAGKIFDSVFSLGEHGPYHCLEEDPATLWNTKKLKVESNIKFRPTYYCMEAAPDDYEYVGNPFEAPGIEEDFKMLGAMTYNTPEAGVPKVNPVPEAPEKAIQPQVMTAISIINYINYLEKGVGSGPGRLKSLQAFSKPAVDPKTIFVQKCPSTNADGTEFMGYITFVYTLFPVKDERIRSSEGEMKPVKYVSVECGGGVIHLSANCDSGVVAQLKKAVQETGRVPRGFVTAVTGNFNYEDGIESTSCGLALFALLGALPQGFTFSGTLMGEGLVQRVGGAKTKELAAFQTGTRLFMGGDPSPELAMQTAYIITTKKDLGLWSGENLITRVGTLTDLILIFLCGSMLLQKTQMDAGLAKKPPVKPTEEARFIASKTAKVAARKSDESALNFLTKLSELPRSIQPELTTPYAEEWNVGSFLDHCLSLSGRVHIGQTVISSAERIKVEVINEAGRLPLHDVSFIKQLANRVLKGPAKKKAKKKAVATIPSMHAPERHRGVGGLVL